MTRARSWVSFFLMAALGACDCGSGNVVPRCASVADCATGEACIDGRCVDARVDAGLDGAQPLDAPGADACSAAASCGGTCCAADELCLDAMRCVRDLGPCAGDGDCRDDGYCAAALGRCIPYDGTHDRSDACEVELRPGVFRTRVQCEWTGPPAGDAFPSHVNVSNLALVIDFRIGRGPDEPAHPSIVIVAAPADGGTNAVIRILDGTTCAQEATLSDFGITAGAAIAAGDLDGDGRAEIVAPIAAGGAAAWTYDDTMGAWRVLWRTPDTSVSGYGAITLADLDDDGVPEVLDGAAVYGADGALRSAAAGSGDGYCSPGDSYVAMSIAADVDLDGRLELVQGSGVWEWDTAASTLVREAYSTGPGIVGPVAIADFGDYPGRAGDAPGRPELASIADGAGALITIGGDVVFGPIAFPGGRDGGNPTIADFDGDGRPEFATAGYTSYTVFDPDCLAGAARGGTCVSGRTDGILWTRPIQENSCAIMGSTVFDFEGDGPAEVVYADECFARVFDGRDGHVVWSRRRSSATWIEGPTVADTDGDFHAEMVMTATDAYRPSCPALDPIDPGMGCFADADCPAGGRCGGGLCRCTADADCGDAELSCVGAIDGSDAMGSVCRARFEYTHGLRIYADIRDRWAGSRGIWNQHAYDVTNVNDDGTIPRGSLVRRNWEVPGLNNFRQNVQGGLAAAGSSDLTVTGVRYGLDCTAAMPSLELVASACNRGSLGVPAGVEVAFYDRDPGAGGTEVCRATTTRALLAAECEELSCTWSMAPTSMPLAVFLRVDPDGEIAECLDDNNDGSLAAQCPPPFM